MSSGKGLTSPQGAASWPCLPRDVADHCALTPQHHDGRRASWDGSQPGMAPEDEPTSSMTGRRSLVEFFGSLGKGGKRKGMTSHARRKEIGTRPTSQFYVDLPVVSTRSSSLPQDHAHCPSLSSSKVTPAPGEAVQQQQPENPRRPDPCRAKGTVRGVLVLPKEVREASAFRRRVHLFVEESSPEKPVMGGAPSVEELPQQAVEERVAPYVTQQYGSMLAELTRRHASQRHGPHLSAEAAVREHSDSGDDEDGEDRWRQGGGEAPREEGQERGHPGSECDPEGSMTSSVPCDTNLLTPSPSDLTPAASPDLTSQEKRDRKIFLIAQEVMTSERVFVDVLRLLNVDFRRFVSEWREGTEGEGGEGQQDGPSGPTLPNEDLDKILNYLPQLQNLNEEILSDLEVRIADWDRRRKISDIIVRKGPFLKLYSAYIREFQNQSDHLDHCCQAYPAFDRALRQFEASERCTKLNLKHYMLKPVQRIPQYRLLLEEYLKFLPEGSPDYLDTQTALAVVANVAAHANDTMKQGTNFMKMLALQDRLSSTSTNSTSTTADLHDTSSSSSSSKGQPRYELLRPGRYLLKEGELLKLCRREMQPRYFILLSDVLLYTSFATSNPGGSLRLNYELPLEGMRVVTPKAEDFKNEFSVISTSRSFTLQASSAEERNEWLTALREAISDNASRRSSFLQAKLPVMHPQSSLTLGKQAPVWIPDYRVTMCQQCTTAFTLTFRRHHCRACGKVVCDPCSANRAPLHYKNNQVARVCDTCFEVLQQDFEVKFKTLEEEEEKQHQDTRPQGKQVANLKSQFKRGIRESSRSRFKKKVPERLLEVSASDASSQMSGYLRMMVRRSWRRGWFVLKDRVLYEYRAPQDVCALYSLPVLGYQVNAINKDREVAEDLDDCLAFRLTHSNQQPLIFQTDSPHLAEKWIQAMKESVVLS